MTHTKPQVSTPSRLQLMGPESLKAICGAPGPFVTVYLPACHPGAADLPRTSRMKSMLREAYQELKQRRYQGDPGQLLKPLEELAAQPQTGGSSSVVFVGPGTFLHLRLLAPPSERLIVASHPHITPLLSHLVPLRQFYILAISKKLLRLGLWDDGMCAEVALPAGIPRSFKETLELEQPDHDLQNRSPAGSAATQGGAAQFARFGTGTEHDLINERLRRYLQHTDRALAGILHGAPLIVMGTTPEIAAYQAVSEYPRVLPAKAASTERVGWVELGERAQDAVLNERRGQAERVLADFLDTGRRDHVTSGVREVLDAALEGRVHQLLVGEDTEYKALLGPSFPMGSFRLEGEQDLINAAAVETIRERGEVYMVDPRKLAPSQTAAILRYSV